DRQARRRADPLEDLDQRPAARLRVWGATRSPHVPKAPSYGLRPPSPPRGERDLARSRPSSPLPMRRGRRATRVAAPTEPLGRTRPTSGASAATLRFGAESARIK